MRSSRFFVVMFASVAALLVLAGSSTAQTVATIHNFNYVNGDQPGYVTLVQGRDGMLYGTTQVGGKHGAGVVFKQKTGGGGYAVIHDFDGGGGGGGPVGGLTLGQDGNFYGTASYGGGPAAAGILFRISPAGVFTVLYNFTGGTDGGYPYAAPIQGADGSLYGTTLGAVALLPSTVYKYTLSGSFSTVYTFDLTALYNVVSPLMQASDGNLYVTAGQGGNGCGSIVKMTTAGVVLAIHNFDCVLEGERPTSALFQASDGNLYGVAEEGGAYGWGTVYRFNGQTEAFTVLYNFGKALGDGLFPWAGVTEGTDGKLYGTTWVGGSAQAGSIFKITFNGTYRQLYSFPSIEGTAFALAVPVQYTSGRFYSVTTAGGTYNQGTVYSLDMGLGPFVTFVQSQGKPGQTAQILGQGFIGTTGVTFNSIPATSFSVANDSFVTAIVPSGATTGKVVVSTPGGALTSNKNFTIIQ